MSHPASEQQHSTPPEVQITRGKRERHLLSEYVRVEEELLPDFVRPILLMIGIAVFGFLLWASLTNLSEVAVASGEVAPDGAIKVVQHLDGGIVREILVESREAVELGQVLLRLDGSKPLADLNQMLSRHTALRLRSERLRAITEERQPDFSFADPRHASLVTDQQSIYTNQLATWRSSLEIINRQIEQRERRLDQLNQNLSTAEKQFKLTAQFVKVREGLAK